jgi:hypothetical protein
MMNFVVPKNQQWSPKPRRLCNIYMVHNHRPIISNQQTSSQHIHIFSSIATDDMSLSNEVQNAISAVSVVQTPTSKTAKEFEFGSLQKEFNLFETSGVRNPNLDMLLTECHTANINRH